MELTPTSSGQLASLDAQETTVSGGPGVGVLVIDDNEQFRMMMTELLKPLGFEVRTAGNPVKGLELFTREKDTFKLVIVDYYMPQLDGAKTFEWLRKLNPDVKVIICSGADELHLRQLQAQHNIDGYLHKPFRIQEAVQLIRRLVQLPDPVTA